MNRIVCATLLAGVGTVGPFIPAAAQTEVPPTPSRLSVDFTMGIQLTAGDGTYRDEEDEYTTLGGDVLFGLRTVPLLGGYLVTGVSASAHLAARSQDDRCVPGPDDSCIPYFPALRMVAGHLGLESRSGSSRILAGLASVSSSVAGGSLGVQLRFEGTARVAGHLGLVFGLRMTMVPDHGGNGFQVYSGGLGVRLR